MANVALCMIVKGSDEEADHLRRCLSSVKGFVDGIFLNINAKPGHKPSKKVMRIAKEFTDKIITTEWNDDFAEARNANFAQVSPEYDWILWLDADDTVDKPDKIRKVAEASLSYDSIYVDYLYDKDEEGNPVTIHMVARLIKNNAGHHWKGRIHETLIETRSVTQGMTKDFMVVHHADEKRKDESLLRNAELLE